MNERIEKLFGQALDQAVPETWTTLTPAQLSKLKDKFAELIVRECMNICAEREEDIRNRIKDEGKAATAYMCRAYIKEHFGVEE